MSGVMLRSTGVKWDLASHANPMNVTANWISRFLIGKNGDNYDRYVMRMEEMRESTKIMRQCIAKMPIRSGGQLPTARLCRRAAAR